MKPGPLALGPQFTSAEVIRGDESSWVSANWPVGVSCRNGPRTTGLRTRLSAFEQKRAVGAD